MTNRIKPHLAKAGELAQRASVVYFVQCHSQVAELYDLFRYLYNRKDHFVFGADAKSSDDLHALIRILTTRFENVHSVSPGLISWGGFSIVKSIICGIRFAVNSLTDWSHFVTISGQHLPLRGADGIAAELEENTTYIAAWKFDPYNTVAASDLLHRFEMHYKEVPGVGVFGVFERPTDALLKAMLYSGSNWIVLAKELCQRITSSSAVPPLLDYFSHSLISDETALQTIVLGAGLGVDLQIENRALTFVSKGPNMLFTERDFEDARNLGYLFIRKRPRQLSEKTLINLEGFISADLIEVEPLSLSSVVETHAQDDGATQLVVEAITEQLRLEIPDVSIGQLRPSQVLCPRLYLQIRHPNIIRDMFVAVLSETLKDFKVALVWFDPFNGDYSRKYVNGRLATVLKVRVHDIAYNREIHVNEDPFGGFIQLELPDQIGQITRVVSTYLKAAEGLSIVPRC